MERNNYQTMVEQARALFLTYDQQELIDRWQLRHDEKYIYVNWFHTCLKVDRKSGQVLLYSEEGDIFNREFERYRPTDDVMVIYDYLCYAKERVYPSGNWVSISSLGGIIGAGHEQGLSHEREAARFAGKCTELSAACEILGGTKAQHGDVSYILPVIGYFQIWMQFYDADDEFPASMKFLFDGNALKYMHYETLWYVMNSVNRLLISYVDGLKNLKNT